MIILNLKWIENRSCTQMVYKTCSKEDLCYQLIICSQHFIRSRKNRSSMRKKIRQLLIFFFDTIITTYYHYNDSIISLEFYFWIFINYTAEQEWKIWFIYCAVILLKSILKESNLWNKKFKQNIIIKTTCTLL